MPFNFINLIAWCETIDKKAKKHLKTARTPHAKDETRHIIKTAARVRKDAAEMEKWWRRYGDIA